MSKYMYNVRCKVCGKAYPKDQVKHWICEDCKEQGLYTPRYMLEPICC